MSIAGYRMQSLPGLQVDFRTGFLHLVYGRMPTLPPTSQFFCIPNTTLAYGTPTQPIV